MAKISQLPDAGSLTGDELIPVVRAGMSYTAKITQLAKGASVDAAKFAAASQTAAATAALTIGTGAVTYDPQNARKSGRYTSGSAGATMFDPVTFGSQGVAGAGVVDQMTSYFEVAVNGCKYKVLRYNAVAQTYDFVAETALFNAVVGENVMNLDGGSALTVTPDCVVAIYTPAAGFSQAGNPTTSPTGLDVASGNPTGVGATIAGDFKGAGSAASHSDSARMVKCRIRFDGRLNTIERLASAYPEGPVKLIGALGPDQAPLNINGSLPPGSTWFYNPNSTRTWLVPVATDGSLVSIAGYAAVAGRTELVVFDETGRAIYKEDVTIAATGRFRVALRNRVRVRPGYRAGASQGGGAAKFGFLSDASAKISHPLTAGGYVPFGSVWAFAPFEVSTVPLQLEVAPLVEAPKTTPRVTLNAGDRYVRGADVLPVLTDTGRVAGWGSSTMELIAPDFAGTFTGLDAAYYNGGKGGEQMQDHLARLGSHPALLTADGGSIPASGPVNVNAPGAQGLGLTASILPFTGTLAGIPGTFGLNGDASRHVFTRTTAGAAVPIGAGTPFVPDVGNQYRDAINLLNIGKNNINDGANPATAADIVQRTHEAFDWLSPLVRRSLVLNHFINTDLPAADPQYVKTSAVNAGLAARYGPLLLDVYSFVCKGIAMFGQTVWQASGIAPTQTDLNQQAAGTKPSSLSRDALHMNDAAEIAVAWLLRQKMLSLGWY